MKVYKWDQNVEGVYFSFSIRHFPKSSFLSRMMLICGMRELVRKVIITK